MTTDELDLLLLVGSAVLLVAVVAVRLAIGTSFPTLLLYLGLGLVLGENVLGLEFDDEELTAALGYAALVVILAEGGLTTTWSNIKPAVPAAAMLATVGTLASVGVVAVAARELLDVGWQDALLIGAVLSPTDSAAVFSVLRRVPIRPRLGGMLEAESGFNDAPVVILVVALAGADAPSWWGLAGEMTYELALGAVLGLLIGFLAAEGLRRIALPASGLYPLTVLALCVFSYAATVALHASGFLAVYLTGLVLGNSRLPHRPATRGFVEGVAWLAQIGLFVMLGLLATPSELGPSVLPALGVGLVLIAVARPLSVLVSVIPLQRWVPTTWPDRALLSWAGLRGAVPIVLAARADDQRIFNLVFVLVVVYTIVQGPTLPYVARKLGVTAGRDTVPLEIEASPLVRLDADLLQVHVTPRSRLAGVEVFELRLPDEAAVTLVVRGNRTLVPGPTTRIHEDDELIIVVSETVRPEVERRLQAISLGGRLADWQRPPGVTAPGSEESIRDRWRRIRRGSAAPTNET
jgi:cell volume regulation protein A